MVDLLPNGNSCVMQQVVWKVGLQGEEVFSGAWKCCLDKRHLHYAIIHDCLRTDTQHDLAYRVVSGIMDLSGRNLLRWRFYNDGSISGSDTHCMVQVREQILHLSE